MGSYHEPVLLQESVEGLAVRKDGLYVDVTYGGGGHSAEILKRLGTKGRLCAFDRDGDTAGNLIKDKRLVLIQHNYRFLKNYLRYFSAVPADGILADLGVSSHQIDDAGRGFSTRFDGQLDLRMDRRRKMTAGDLVNTSTTEELTRIFKEYGELDHAKRIALTLVSAREKEKIETTADLKAALRSLVPGDKEQKFFARIFQALRIEVNGELDALKDMLRQSLEVLKPGGRLVVISYHSLEDRLVKNFMKAGNTEGIEDKDPIFGKVNHAFDLISRKAIVAGEAEINRNPRARSARLRIAEKR